MNQAKRSRAVVVIGLDGLEPTIVEPMLAAGELPNLAHLRSRGGYARLQTTYPAQTPVAWSTFATGTNPGGHGIFDFITRDPKTYAPLLALHHYEQKNVFVPPRAVNGRRGTPIWEFLSDAGIPSTILRHPLTYPPDNLRGRMLGGVGVPDLRGGLGTGTFYTTAEKELSQDGERVVSVQIGEDDTIATHIMGPHKPNTQTDFQLDMHLHLDRARGRGMLRSTGQPNELEICLGQWSDWLKVRFKTGPLLSVRGLVRFYLVSLAPVFQLYASPVNFDPEAPLYPISAPPEYARELAARLGTYYTVGMAEEDTALKNCRIGEDAFLAQCGDVLREREQMMTSELERQREGLFFCLFDTPDRIQHLFWRMGEPDHPANRKSKTLEMQHVIRDHYRALDVIVGRALQFSDDQTLFIVMSDHGMASFQRGLNLNTWLYENGLLALKSGIQPGAQAGDFLRAVDWGRTQAFALGLGGIYLNLKGREANGIVDVADARYVQEAIVKGLSGLCDPERGQVAIRSVVSRDQVYRGSYAAESPDLLVNFAAGYRVSWGTPLGGVPAGIFEDNEKKWSGDHAIDPALVPGVLFMNRSFSAQEARMIDLAPTILSALGLPMGSDMEGASLIG